MTMRGALHLNVVSSVRDKKHSPAQFVFLQYQLFQSFKVLKCEVINIDCITKDSTTV